MIKHPPGRIMPSEPADDATVTQRGPGVRLGPYLIETLLGTGGMGEVYRARDTRLGRIVAIKVVRSQGGGRGDFHRRLEREARAISVLNNPHICTLYDIGEQDGSAYLVMEYLEGQTLRERLARPLTPSPSPPGVAGRPIRCTCLRVRRSRFTIRTW